MERLPNWLKAAKAKAEHKKAVEASYMSTWDWIQYHRKEKAKAKTEAEGEGLVSNGNLLPFSEVKNARNRRYTLLRELSRAVWNCTLPMHSVRYCSRRAIPAKTKNKRGDFVPTGKSGNIEIHSREIEGAKNTITTACFVAPLPLSVRFALQLSKRTGHKRLCLWDNTCFKMAFR